MYNLETYLALEILGEKQIKNLKNLNIIPDEEGNIWLYFEVVEKSKKEGESTKPYKKNISHLIDKLGETYYTYVATDMLRQGYSLVTIEGGWIVHGGDEPYQLGENTCTCMSREKPCKHLVFLQWHHQYRSKCNTIRSLYK